MLGPQFGQNLNLGGHCASIARVHGAHGAKAMHECPGIDLRRARAETARLFDSLCALLGEALELAP